jgi:hypothetical protein
VVDIKYFVMQSNSEAFVPATKPGAFLRRAAALPTAAAVVIGRRRIA